MTLYSEDPKELETMLQQLTNVESIAVDLEMNLSKTQIIFNNYIDENDQIITINGFQLKVVTSYMYLGQLVSIDSNKEY